MESEPDSLSRPCRLSRAGRMPLATNVLELRRPQRHIAPARLEDAVRIRDRRDIHGAALALEEAARGIGLRILAWHDLATLEPMVDADGQPLDCGAFG